MVIDRAVALDKCGSVAVLDVAAVGVIGYALGDFAVLVVFGDPLRTVGQRLRLDGGAVRICHGLGGKRELAVLIVLL